MKKSRAKLFSVLAIGAVLGGSGLYLTQGSLTPALGEGATVKIGEKIAPFTLPSASGGNVTVGDWTKSKATVVMFIATRCPISNAYNGRMAKLAAAYGAKNVTFYGVNSNKMEAIPEIAQHAKANGLTFTILKDAGNKIADKFGAAVTPEVYVIDSGGSLVYKGKIDDRKEEDQVTERPLAGALDAVLAGKAVPVASTQAFGCSIKRE